MCNCVMSIVQSQNVWKMVGSNVCEGVVSLFTEIPTDLAAKVAKEHA